MSIGEVVTTASIELAQSHYEVLALQIGSSIGAQLIIVRSESQAAAKKQKVNHLRFFPIMNFFCQLGGQLIFKGG